MVVKCMVDGIPAYEVENDANKKRQVLHRVQLLLWLTEPEGEPLRINCISIKSGLTRAELVTPLCQSVKLGMVPRKLIYGLNTAMFESRQESPELMMGNNARGALMGVPHNGTGHRIPCDKFSHWRSLWTLLRDVSARWARPTWWCLESWSYRGAGNGTGWLLMETIGTQVPRLPLTNLQWELHLCRLLNEPPFLFAHLKLRLARGHAIFSLLGRGVRDAIVTTGGTQTLGMPGMKGDTWAVPTQNDQCHITFMRWAKLPAWCESK